MSSGFSFGAKTTGAPTFGTGSITFGTPQAQPAQQFGFGSIASSTPALFGTQPTATTSTLGAFKSPGFGAAPAAPSTGFGFGATAPSIPTQGFSFGSTATPSSGSTFGTPTAATQSTGLGFGAPASTGLTFGTAAAPNTATAQNLSFGTPASTVSGLNFGAPAPASTGLSFGTPATAATGGLSFGAPAASTGTSLAFGPATSTAGLSFGAPAPSTGLGFSAPTAAPTAATTGLNFGTPTTIPSFGLGTSTPGTGLSFGPTTTSAPTGGLSFGTPAATSAPTLGLSFGTAVTTSAPALSFGGATASSLPSTGLSFGTATTGNLSFGGATTTTTAASFGLGTTAATTAPASLGLGGLPPAQSKPGATVAAQKEVPPKDQPLPNEFITCVDQFKTWVQEEKNRSSEVARCSVKEFHKVENELDALNYQFIQLETQLQTYKKLSEQLKFDTAKSLQTMEIAQRTQETPPGLQYDNTAPLQFFLELAESFEKEMQSLKVKIENTEKFVRKCGEWNVLTSQDLTLGLRRLHETFVALAGRMQSIHNQVEIHKENFLTLRKQMRDYVNPFETTTKVVDLNTIFKNTLKSPPKFATGPTPFNNMALGSSNVALLSQQTQQPSFTTTPTTTSSLGYGLGNTTFGTSLSASTLFKPATFGTQSFNMSASFQLQKPPTGNKRGKQ